MAKEMKRKKEVKKPKKSSKGEFKQGMAAGIAMCEKGKVKKKGKK
jgi:hypothetical protein